MCNVPNDVRNTLINALIDMGSSPHISVSGRESVAVAVRWLESLPAAPEPDWSQAPEWAQWWAVDANEDSYLYGKEPFVMNDMAQWYEAVGDVDRVFDECVSLPVGTDWRTTLRKRPNDV